MGWAFWRLNRFGGRDTPFLSLHHFFIFCSIVTKLCTKILQTVLHQMTTTFLARYHNFCWGQHFSWTRVKKIWKFMTFRFLNKGSMNKTRPATIESSNFFMILCYFILRFYAILESILCHFMPFWSTFYAILCFMAN